MKPPTRIWGPDYFDGRDREAIVRRSVRRIEQLGHRVTVEEAD